MIIIEFRVCIDLKIFSNIIENYNLQYIKVKFNIAYFMKIYNNKEIPKNPPSTNHHINKNLYKIVILDEI